MGFFSSNGDLLEVIFDDVSEEEDHQILEFKKHKIENMCNMLGRQA